MKNGIKLLGTAILAAWVLQGCTTASSMRVEVQVYKGPLSKEVAIQEGELKGVLVGAAKSLNGVIYDVEFGIIKKYQKDTCGDEPECQCFSNVTIAGLKEKIDHAKAFQTRATELAEAINTDGVTPSDATLRSVAELASAMKLEALDLSYGLNAYSPDSLKQRILTTGYINLLAETSNQLSSRADALLKQRDHQTPSAKLAQSVYLRDSAPTSLLNMYAWDDAMAVNKGEGRGWFDIGGALAQGAQFDGDVRADRVRALEQHFADHYWSTINTVTASGEGEVGMALIKDDIGNWNLKNFSSDPTELVKAYKEVGLAALSTAADFARRSQTAPLSAAQKFVSAADRFNFGGNQEGSAALGSLAAKLRKATEAQLQALVTEAKDKPASLQKQREAQEEKAGNTQITAIKGCTGTSPVAVTAAEQARQSAETVRNALPLNVASDLLGPARTTADEAMAAAREAATGQSCERAAEAIRLAKVAGYRFEAFKLEQEEHQLPATAQARAKTILDDFERTLLELTRASLIASTPPEDKAEDGPSLPAILQTQ